MYIIYHPHINLTICEKCQININYYWHGRNDWLEFLILLTIKCTMYMTKVLRYIKRFLSKILES